ncbi:uncharacterized protein Pyn_13788 [Prunus yedoensis var. nudiflora]|uniref:Uncharacterized protein n=1 Tax=Prunus yedoensis var. nudiflora TaxID=2094558 RepID=A0A314Y8A1_PRUYE|nr:uncharacterized protein Pyn_13788 [Prunus yedoensis var. nudiflora]
MRAYSLMVHPMTSEDLWPKCHRPPLMPPLYHKQPGRPRKKRMRSAGKQPRKSNPTTTKLQRYWKPSVHFVDKEAIIGGAALRQKKALAVRSNLNQR